MKNKLNKKNLHVMIVDDMKIGQVSLANKIKGEGFHGEITFASGGDEAYKLLLELRKTRPVNIIFCDLIMPNCDGLQFLKKMSENQELKNIPVFMVTSSTEIDDLHNCLSMGSAGYILKQYSSKRILEKIEDGWKKFFTK